MGILCELPPDHMLAKLHGEVKHWEKSWTPKRQYNQRCTISL